MLSLLFHNGNISNLTVVLGVGLCVFNCLEMILASDRFGICEIQKTKQKNFNKCNGWNVAKISLKQDTVVLYGNSFPHVRSKKAELWQFIDYCRFDFFIFLSVNKYIWVLITKFVDPCSNILKYFHFYIDFDVENIL